MKRATEIDDVRRLAERVRAAAAELTAFAAAVNGLCDRAAEWPGVRRGCGGWPDRCGGWPSGSTAGRPSRTWGVPCECIASDQRPAAATD
jgi:hypothetical protein